MKSLTLENYRSPFHFDIPAMPRLLVDTEKWISSREANWQSNRLAMAASGVFIQVTFAAFMIAISGAAGVSPLIYTIGIFFAFLADGLAFARAPKGWVLAGFVASILVNLGLGVYFFIHVV